tara:strand:- start:343 stop:789 length:447 start_codon:yes stop_codon:yes gene_type:complete
MNQINAELNTYMIKRMFNMMDKRIAMCKKYGVTYDSDINSIYKLDKRLEAIRRYGCYDTYEDKFKFETMDKYVDAIEIYSSDNGALDRGTEEVSHYIYGHGLVTFNNEKERDLYVVQRGCWFYYINELDMYFDDRGLSIVHKLIYSEC